MLYRMKHFCLSDVYMCGGYDGETIFGDFWALDLLTLQWRRLHTDLPQPIYFHSAAVTTVSADEFVLAADCLALKFVL